MRRSIMLALMGVLLLGGCGGADHHSTPPYTVHAHACASTDYAMQCALHNQPQRKALAPPPKASTARGVDYAWSMPSCGTFRANGWSIAATYLDTYDRSKGWTPSRVAAADACGLKKIAVWETGSNRATAGYYAGNTDGQLALAEAAWVRWQPHRPIFFAVDCDCSGHQVDAYFRGVNAAMKPAGRPTGAYGGYYPLSYLFSAHLISYGWQTYAWSGSRWNQSCLEQWLNSSAVDYDRAICGDYGQTPYNATPPVDPYAKYPKAYRSFQVRRGTVRAREYYTVKTFDQAHCTTQRNRTCTTTRDHLGLLLGRATFIAGNRRDARGHWHKLSKPRWGSDQLGSRAAGMRNRLNHSAKG